MNIKDENKELRQKIPISSHKKLMDVQLYTKSFTRSEALVIAIDLAYNKLSEEFQNRIGVVNGSR